jgi:hypothetical protein
MALNSKFNEVPVRRFDYEDHSVISVDFGPGVDPIVDLVDGTAILIVDDTQHELDLPEGEVEVFNRNGVITFEIRQ